MVPGETRPVPEKNQQVFAEILAEIAAFSTKTAGRMSILLASGWKPAPAPSGPAAGVRCME